jgi:hypothetical protein
VIILKTGITSGRLRGKKETSNNTKELKLLDGKANKIDYKGTK